MKETKDFWTGLGTALVFLSICLGIGGCYRMSKDTSTPLIQPTIEINIKL